METTVIAGSINPVEVVVREPRTYRVLSDGSKRWADGLLMGSVHYSQCGWRFIPSWQALPSRKFWPTADAAVNARLKNYRLEAL